jgi:hypothetical protein
MIHCLRPVRKKMSRRPQVGAKGMVERMRDEAVERELGGESDPGE